MTASERLDEIQARYSEWHQDRGHHTPAPETDTWSDADHPDESMDHCIVRNDVPALVAALRAVLDQVTEWRDESFSFFGGPVDEATSVRYECAQEVLAAVEAALGELAP